MKKQKRNLLRKMMAVLLSMALIVGMVSSSLPLKTLAQENGETSLQGNLLEDKGDGEDGLTTQLLQTTSETTGETVTGTYGLEAGTVSGNDIKADGMSEMIYAAMTTADDAVISCSLDGGTTWVGCDAIENVLFFVTGYTSCKNPIIRLNKDLVVDAPISLLYNNNNVLVDGQGHTVKRGNNRGYLFCLEPGYDGTLTFQNVTIDGGAVWDDAGNAKDRQNSGFSSGGNGWLIYCCNADAKVILDQGTVLQNNHLNNSTYNGAAVMMESGSLTMKDGAVIRNNTAIGTGTSENKGGGGGAVHVDRGASFTMEGGEIYGNYASVSGGAIINQGSLTFKGGIIRNNVSGNNGGAVGAQGATFISGGEIKNNQSFAGGGVAILAGTTKISGGAVYDNTATIGGGVYNALNLSVSGTAKINHNSNGNVYLPSGKIINIDAPLSDGAAIGVMTENVPADESSPVSITGANGADYSSYFTSDWAGYAIVNSTDNVVQIAFPVEEHKHGSVTFTAWTATDSLPTDAGNYYLTENVILSETWNVPGNTTGLCLNGKTISASGEYHVVKIAASSTLNLYDCQNAGNITGGKQGGVWNEGSFHMYGGKISGNGSEGYCNGGVLNSGFFQMYDGEISGNTSGSAAGGGVHTYGEFIMHGGKISGNTAGSYGGGVHINGNGRITVGGNAVIMGNTVDGKENNVYLNVDGRTTVEIDSSTPLSDLANIGITTSTAPTAENPVAVTGHNKGDYSQYFYSDNSAYEIVNTDDCVQLTVKRHTHTLTLTAAKPATCTEDGNNAYYVCSGDSCGKYFSDAAGTQEITDKSSVIISKTGHSYDETAWGYTGADGHAHKCRNCDAYDTVQAHTPGAAATETTPQICTVCGYEIAPATGTESGNGTVTSEVKPGENAPATNISTPAEELEDMLLTDEERQQVQDGTDIRIVLEVQDAGDTVSDSDQAGIEQTLNGYTLGQYLNIDLYKLVGEERTDITETAEKIRIVIAVPDSLKNADGSKTRTFAVIRMHNGIAEILTDLDGSDDTITIETDRFSTYAVIYQDKPASGDDNSDNGNNGGDNSDNGNNGDSGSNNNNNDSSIPGQKDSEPRTGDSAPLKFYATFAMIAGFTYLLLYFTDRKRGMTEEEKKEFISAIVRWAKRGGRIRRCLALAAIFVLLVYYHSLGKQICADAYSL